MAKLGPIRTKEAYAAAMKEIDRLWNTVKPGTPDGDAFEVLTMLVEAYEKEHYPVEPPDPIEAIKHYMESNGLTNLDLVPYLGSAPRVSEILSRKRPLTLAMIRNLETLGIPASILVKEYHLDIKPKPASRKSTRLVKLVVGNPKTKTETALLPRRRRDRGKELAV